MALINCPECGKQISDRAISCPNCGYPLSNQDVQSDIQNAVESSNYILILNKVYRNAIVDATKAIKEAFDTDLYTAKLVADNSPTILTRNITHDEAVRIKTAIDCPGVSVTILPYDSSKSDEDILSNFKTSDNFRTSEVHCPRCGSTNVTAGPRGVNWTMGFIGASKTVNRCAKCGYTWKP
ncbi:zinc ribbon domain-containing protein [uncultured Dysosmobacter sp.]|uniref:zinc ribbon domain-containing protein n=1 Tax=uncultured Dysosmobacter sp. TaxID=2591384 RepID=UPI002637E1E8|nr:zinc ribbon domain-containing protein [uncultured Dysosmobacter sp.]